MALTRRNRWIFGVVTLVFSLALVVSASPSKRNCADDQDGTCDLYISGIQGTTGSFLNGWVEAGSFFGKSSVHAGSSDQTEMNGNGFYGNIASVNQVYTGGVSASNTVYAGTVSATFLYATYKSFRIDDPTDPENRYLNHWSVESSEMKNIYDGVVTLDGNGRAIVKMPEWFDGLNADFRYQLTAIGAPAANLYVGKEIANREFTIAGGKPNLKVSWQVTGVRHDAAARTNRTPIVEEKAPQDRGKYVNPAAFGKPESMGMQPQRPVK
jgi:hypothetical protein